MQLWTCLLVLCTLSLTGRVSSQRSPNPCHGRSVDICISSLVLFVQGPTQGNSAGTDADLEKQCTFLKEADDCFRNYTRTCTTSSQKQMFMVMRDGGRQLYRQFCFPNSPGRDTYKRNAPCLQKTHKDTRRCYKDLQVVFEKVQDVTSKKKIPLACCGYRRMKKCSGDIILKQCGQETLDFSNQLKLALTSRLPNVVCHDYRPRSPKCKDLPPPGTQLTPGKQTSALNRLLAAYIST